MRLAVLFFVFFCLVLFIEIIHCGLPIFQGEYKIRPYIRSYGGESRAVREPPLQSVRHEYTPAEDRFQGVSEGEIERQRGDFTLTYASPVEGEGNYADLGN